VDAGAFGGLRPAARHDRILLPLRLHGDGDAAARENVNTPSTPETVMLIVTPLTVIAAVLSPSGSFSLSPSLVASAPSPSVLSARTWGCFSGVGLRLAGQEVRPTNVGVLPLRVGNHRLGKSASTTPAGTNRLNTRRRIWGAPGKWIRSLVEMLPVFTTSNLT